METEKPLHVALPLKYRPMTFSDVVGQEHVVRTLRNAIASGRIANAYLFIGPRGIGKTTTSRILAKALNCTHPNGVEPCGACENCVQIAAGRSIDVTELDAASHNKVEDVKPIIDAVQFKPVASRYKIFIIDECHMLTGAAWNALLKTLEEPPPYVKFIFATTEGDKMLATIVSRCQRFDLRRIQTHQIVGRLREICDKEGISADEDALLAIARGAEGGMRDALSSLDQLIAFTGDHITENDALGVFGLVSRQALENLAGAILTGDAATILRSVETFDSAGKNMRRLAAELMQHFRNLLVYQTLGDKENGLEATPDQIKTLAAQAKLCPGPRLFRIADTLAEMEDKLRRVLSVRTLIEMSLIRASRIATVASVEELMRAVRDLRAGLPVALAPTAAAPAPKTTPAAAREDTRPPVAVPAASRPSSPAPSAQHQAPSASEKDESPSVPKHVLTDEERRKIVDDPKLNKLMAEFPGAQIAKLD